MLEPAEKEAAKERMIAAHASPGKLPELKKGDSRDKVAAFTGVSGRTLDKADALVSARFRVSG